MDRQDTSLKSTEQKPSRSSRFGRFWKLFKILFVTGFVLGVFALIFVGVFIIRATRDLPSLEVLREYSPAVMSRVHAGDGKLIAEYGIEKRVFVPISSIPKDIQHALVASEDKRFYQHHGFDPKGFARAMLANVKHKLKGERLEGGSTLTQQVAKHFVVGDERSVVRKIRDIFIARRIEKVFSKDEILELYLNDVYFGRRAYGIAGAALNYFNKPLDKLTLGEMAYLAGLVKGPSNYQIDRNYERAVARRNYVLGRMVEDGYITREQAEKAKAEKLELHNRLRGDEYLAAEYFVAEVRKKIGKMYGEDELNSGGLSIRTTLDTKMQLAARKALRRGLEMFDRRHGWRGPLAHVSEGEDWKDFLANYKAPPDIGDWKLAVVLAAKGKRAELGFLKEENGTLDVADIDWAAPALPEGKVGKKPTKITDVVKAGDVILVEAKPNPKHKKALENSYNLRQIPEINGGIIAMDPHTGRVLALVGGYSFSQSQFNRATQAYRQPGSSFKPFVYAAALDSGFTPVSKILDAPFVIRRSDSDRECEQTSPDRRSHLNFGDRAEAQKPAEKPQLRGPKDGNEKKECGPVFYKPANYHAGKWYGLSTMRLGLEKSRNAMTVRMANDIGMGIIGRYGRKFGIYDETKPELAWALGAGETTLWRMAAAYSAIDNGGHKVTPRLIDRVQDNKGKTIYKSDKRECPECKVDEWTPGLKPPELPDEREVVLDPVTAYQMTSMLEGVVQRGTGRQMLRLGRPIAGKTGTTNDYKDAWFMGFSPDLVAGVYVGYDTPRTMGVETGARAAGPIFRFFMGDVLKDKPKVPFRIPEGVLLAPVDATSGEPSWIGAPNFIMEAFRPGTEPGLNGGNASRSIGEDETGLYDYDFNETDTPSSPKDADTKSADTKDSGAQENGNAGSDAAKDDGSGGTSAPDNQTPGPDQPETRTPLKPGQTKDTKPPVKPGPGPGGKSRAKPDVKSDAKPEDEALEDGLY